MSEYDFFAEGVRERLLAVIGLVGVDVDAEWALLVERLASEDVETVEVDRSSHRHPLRRTAWLTAIAAATVIVLMPQGRHAVERVTLLLVRTALEGVGIAVEDPGAVVPQDPRATIVAPEVTTPEPTTTEAPTTSQAPTTAQAPITTQAPATTTTTTITSPPPEPDAGHRELRTEGEYARGIRQVHIQLNEAIGYNRSNYEALEGAPELVESLIGQRREFDARLRDTLGHLRQALRAKDRNAASAAHTIIYEIERELGTAGKQ